jgi:hypothetical protein
MNPDRPPSSKSGARVITYPLMSLLQTCQGPSCTFGVRGKLPYQLIGTITYRLRNLMSTRSHDEQRLPLEEAYQADTPLENA